MPLRWDGGTAWTAGCFALAPSKENMAPGSKDMSACRSRSKDSNARGNYGNAELLPCWTLAFMGGESFIDEHCLVALGVISGGGPWPASLRKNDPPKCIQAHFGFSVRQLIYMLGSFQFVGIEDGI